jgi:hypothetical protein
MLHSISNYVPEIKKFLFIAIKIARTVEQQGSSLIEQLEIFRGVIIKLADRIGIRIKICASCTIFCAGRQDFRVKQVVKSLSNN